MKVLILNGPNLNLVGTREPEIYGSLTFEELLPRWQKEFPELTIHYFQSNHEGAIIDKIQASNREYDAVIINAGGLTHTSVAIADAIRSVQLDFVEVHLSNVYKRESYRHHSYLSPHVVGTIAGMGMEVYVLALTYLVRRS